MPDMSNYRAITRDLDNGGRLIAIVTTGGEADGKTDDEILDALQELSRARRLREADAPE